MKKFLVLIILVCFGMCMADCSVSARTVRKDHPVEIINKHTKKNEDGKIEIENDKPVIDIEKCNAELAPLLLEKVEADIKTVDISTLERTEYDEFDSLSYSDIQAILFMIVDDIMVIGE